MSKLEIGIDETYDEFRGGARHTGAMKTQETIEVTRDGNKTRTTTTTRQQYTEIIRR